MATYRFTVLPTLAELAALASSLGIDPSKLTVSPGSGGEFTVFVPVSDAVAAAAIDVAETQAAVDNGLGADADTIQLISDN